MIAVAAVALIDCSGQVLMHRRKLSSDHGGLWEFPGGKVEPLETPDCAMVREAAEELGIIIDPHALAPLSFAALPGQRHVVLLYTCREWCGEPACLIGEAIGWFRPQDLSTLAMPPLDVPLAAALCKLLESTN